MYKNILLQEYARIFLHPVNIHIYFVKITFRELFYFNKIVNMLRKIARGRCTSLQKLCWARTTHDEYFTAE